MNKRVFMDFVRYNTSSMSKAEQDELIGYLDEMIADRIERNAAQGREITEEQCIDEMGDPYKLVEELVAGMESDRNSGNERHSGKQHGNRRHDNYQHNHNNGVPQEPRYVTYDFDVTKITGIDISDCNNGIKIARSQDQGVHVECFQSTDDDYKVEINDDGTLRVKYNEGARFRDRGRNRDIFELINGIWKERKPLILYVPESLSVKITAHTTNGSLNAEDINPSELELESSNSTIHAKHINCGRLVLRTSNAAIKADDLLAVKAEIATSNGKISITKAVCKEQIKVKTSNGAIHFDEIDSYDVTLKTSCGGIHGTLTGRALDYSSDCETSNGSCNIRFINPQANRKLFARTSNASINVDFTLSM